MDEVLYQRKSIEKYGAEDLGMNEDIDYEKAAGYCTSLLKNCPLAISYMCAKVKYLLLSCNLKEAQEFIEETCKRNDIPQNASL